MKCLRKKRYSGRPKFYLPLVAITLAASTACAPELPDFVYSDIAPWQSQDFGSYFIDHKAMSAAKNLTFRHTTEIQNQMRDCLFKNEPDIAMHAPYVKNCFDNAMRGYTTPESGFKPMDFKKDEFIVVFDLDETLLSHWYQKGEAGKQYYDVTIEKLDLVKRPKETWVSPNYIKFIPGWQNALERLSKIPNCKGAVFFTAKEDESALDILRNWPWPDPKLKDFVKGFFTRNYLVRNAKVLKPSKDMRIFDPTLKHVIIVDDNITRLFQPKNVRVFPKFSPDVYFDSPANNIKFFDQMMSQVISEIEDAAAYARANKKTFVHAYFPYSQKGMAYLEAAENIFPNRALAVDWLRKNRGIYKNHFHIAKKVTATAD